MDTEFDQCAGCYALLSAGESDYNPCVADFVPPPSHEVPQLLDDL